MYLLHTASIDTFDAVDVASADCTTTSHQSCISSLFSCIVSVMSAKYHVAADVYQGAAASCVGSHSSGLEHKLHLTGGRWRHCLAGRLSYCSATIIVCEIVFCVY